MNDFEYKGWYCFYQPHPKLSDKWFGSNGIKELSAVTKKDLKYKIKTNNMIIPALFKRENTNPVEYYFRNVSTNKATLRHIINEKTDKTFCGFLSLFAQSYIEEEDYTVKPYHRDTCIKCLLAHEKQVK